MRPMPESSRPPVSDPHRAHLMKETPMTGRTRVRPPLRTLIHRVAAVVSALLIVSVVAAPAATAHDYLVGSTPAAGEVLFTAPQEVAVTLSEVPLGSSDLALSQFVVTGPDGAQVASGDVTLQDSTMSAPVTIEAAGQYEVAWRTVSSDGHPIEGMFAFAFEPGPGEPSGQPSAAGATGSAETAAPSAEAGSAAPSQQPEATPEGSQAAQPEEERVSGVGSILPIVLVAALLVGGIAFVIARTRRELKK